MKSRQLCDEDDEVTETVAISTMDAPALRKSRRVSFAETDEVRSVDTMCRYAFLASVPLVRSQEGIQLQSWHLRPEATSRHPTALSWSHLGPCMP